MPKARRTTAQVQADEEEKLQIKEARARKRAEGVAKVAAIDAGHDMEVLEEEENRVLTLEDMAAAAGDTSDDEDLDVDDDYQDEDTVMEFAEEDFERVEDDDAYRSQNEFEPPKTKLPAAPSKRTKKAAKGETRAEIEAAASTLKNKSKANGEVPAGKKKVVQNGNAAANSRKAGISQHWAAQASTKAPVNSPATPGLGGLDDEDAGGERPEVSEKGPRKNEFITIDLIASSDSDNDTPTRVPLQPARKSKALPSKLRQSVKVESAPQLPALSIKKPTVKAESSGSFQFTPPSHADVRGLPPFIGPTWNNFLGSLHQALYTSHDPMQFGTRANAAAEFQAVLDVKYPRSGYEIVWGDAICTKGAARMGERRGVFGATAIKVVDELFKNKKYYYPLDAPEATNGFQKPDGFLLSAPFIDTVQPFLKNSNYQLIRKKDGKLDLSVLPVGPLVMGAVAVERAYRLHASGKRAENAIPDFSASKYATAANGYLASIRKLTENRWTLILDACDANGASINEAELRSFDTLDGAREQMYEPSSPAPMD
ncbi:hypothetical protein MSAN_01803400 [Mycena sanguinolenta]|uniref:Uncharacterized protein n=1 Tax=Mycena sanguinolenta TaxID=230812 RepID=A0A8H6XSF9_9AGAR|nr:hypothetical protein MSAN_01803400 [Mycena sanguinolenta]